MSRQRSTSSHGTSLRRMARSLSGYPSTRTGTKQRLRTPTPNDTTIYHEPVEICGVWPAGNLVLYMLEDRKVDSAEALLRSAIRKSDAIAVLRSDRGMSDDAHTSAGSRQDLCAFGDDDVNLLFAFQFLSRSELTARGDLVLILTLAGQNRVFRAAPKNSGSCVRRPHFGYPRVHAWTSRTE